MDERRNSQVRPSHCDDPYGHTRGRKRCKSRNAARSILFGRVPGIIAKARRDAYSLAVSPAGGCVLSDGSELASGAMSVAPSSVDGAVEPVVVGAPAFPAGGASTAGCASSANAGLNASTAKIAAAAAPKIPFFSMSFVPFSGCKPRCHKRNAHTPHARPHAVRGTDSSVHLDRSNTEAPRRDRWQPP